MSDAPAIIFFTHLGIGLAALAAARGHHVEGADGVDIFRYTPVVAWGITIAMFGVVILFFIMAAVDSFKWVNITFYVAEMCFFAGGMGGIYFVTLRILVDEHSLCVTSAFRTRRYSFQELGSAVEKCTGMQRAIDVRTSKGKRVLYATDRSMPDYDALVFLLQSRIAQARRDQAQAA